MKKYVSSERQLSTFSQFFRVFIIICWSTDVLSTVLHDNVQLIEGIPVPTSIIKVFTTGCVCAILWFTLGNIKTKVEEYIEMDSETQDEKDKVTGIKSWWSSGFIPKGSDETSKE